MKIKIIDALQRVFGEREPKGMLCRATALANDSYNFQVAFFSDSEDAFYKYVVKGDVTNAVCVKNIFFVASELENTEKEKGFFEYSPTGLYPEVLQALENNIVFGKKGRWHSLWVTLDASAAQTGKHSFSVDFCDPHSGKIIASSPTLELDILPQKLDAQRLIYTDWFHCDALARYYNIPVFSQRFWEICENYIKTAVQHGMNMLLTPVFTPPLDTAPGTERLTVQLVDVEKNGDTYSFSFEKLLRWVETSRRCGVEYFEISPLFTQWGAAYCPKIIATVDGVEKRIFGWDTASDSKEYIDFLDAFLPAIADFLRDVSIAEKTYFHVSDEPSEKVLDRYSFASGVIKKHLQGFHIIDALSDYSFYEKGLVETPVPATDSVEPFRNIENLWVYYCGAQHKNNLSNRFFCMPSARNRIIGIQLYVYNVTGFLHWGYNFYNTQNSFSFINPYLTSAAGATFPSGDSYVVYPAPDGTALPSLRFEVFADGLRDLRALQTLEEKIGRDKVLALLHEGLKYEISMTRYPTDATWLLDIREKVNRQINMFSK